MIQKKKVRYNIQCAYDEKHVFEKIFLVEEGSEEIDSDVEAYCPFCDKMVKITIKGKVVPDEYTLRILEKFKQQDREREKIVR